MASKHQSSHTTKKKRFILLYDLENNIAPQGHQKQPESKVYHYDEELWYLTEKSKHNQIQYAQ